MPRNSKRSRSSFTTSEVVAISSTDNDYLYKKPRKITSIYDFVLCDLIDIECKLNNVEDAQIYLEKLHALINQYNLIEKVPDIIPLYYSRKAEILLLQNKQAEAMELLNEAEKQLPQDEDLKAFILSRKGKINKQQNKYESAIDDFNKALECDFDNDDLAADIYKDYAECRFRGFTQFFSQVKLYPMLWYRAQTYIKHNRYEKAKVNLELLLLLIGDNQVNSGEIYVKIEILKILASVEIKLNFLDNARRYIGQALVLNTFENDFEDGVVASIVADIYFPKILKKIETMKAMPVGDKTFQGESFCFYKKYKAEKKEEEVINNTQKANFITISQ